VVTPVARPLTVPVVFTLATEVLVLLQVPPLPVVVSIMLEPTQTMEGPVMVPAVLAGLTVSVAALPAAPQLLLTI